MINTRKMCWETAGFVVIEYLLIPICVILQMKPLTLDIVAKRCGDTEEDTEVMTGCQS